MGKQYVRKSKHTITCFVFVFLSLFTFAFGLLYYTSGLSNFGSQSYSNDNTLTTNFDYKQPFDVPISSNILRPAIEEYDSNTYPIFKPLLSIIRDWNPDQPDPPSTFRETLQHFNYSNIDERAMAVRYRDAEVPFKVYNVPEFETVSQLWTDAYLSVKLKRDSQYHVEKSINNHFMFWNSKGRSMRGYVPPTEFVQLPFDTWLKRTYEADEIKLGNESAHFYFQSGSMAHDGLRSFISKDLSPFSTTTNNFFITNVNANKGIQCRFSMRGIIAESHFDAGKNMVAMLRGAKRYILTPPHTCKQLGIISDLEHPSYRHSVIDWSDLTQAEAHGFDKVDAIDTIVLRGEVLYIPSYWLHYIVSLKYSIQCNSRSGSPVHKEGAKDIEDCMGFVPDSVGKNQKLGRRKKSFL